MLRKLLKPECLLTVSALTLSACVPAAVEKGNTTIISTPVATATDTSSTVCNPFGGGSAGRSQGLTGKLYYLPSNLPKYESVAQYIANGTKMDASLYFDQVNVPTRPFDEGFITTAGDALETPDQNLLYEWFAIQFQSSIKLTNQDRPGKYQFAMLADDGAVMKADFGSGLQMVVDNDGTHATRFAVSRAPVTLGASDSLPIEISYYQGPRMHIAVMLLWREWPEDGSYIDPLNGKEGNDLFFDSSKTPSERKAAYNQLLSRGWSPVPAENFFLPGSSTSNPCPDSSNSGTATATATDTAVSTATATSTGTSTSTSTSTETDTGITNANWIIQGFDATTTDSVAAIIWTTRGAVTTTKVYVGLSPDNLSHFVESAGESVEIHGIAAEHLFPKTTYYFQAESRDANGRVQLSSIMKKTTK